MPTVMGITGMVVRRVWIQMEKTVEVALTPVVRTQNAMLVVVSVLPDI
jgi:hypothetical protein